MEATRSGGSNAKAGWVGLNSPWRCWKGALRFSMMCSKAGRLNSYETINIEARSHNSQVLLNDVPEPPLRHVLLTFLS